MASGANARADLLARCHDRKAGDAKDSDKLKAAQTVLDRVGLGPARLRS